MNANHVTHPVPRSTLSTELRPCEHLTPTPFRYHLTLSVVTPTPPKPLATYLPNLRTPLNLS